MDETVLNGGTQRVPTVFFHIGAKIDEESNKRIMTFLTGMIQWIGVMIFQRSYICA